MTSQTNSQFASPRINAWALLGLYDPADSTDWGPIRAAQLRAGGRYALALFAANLVGAGLLVMALAGREPLWQLVGWGGVTAMIACAVALRRLRHRSSDRTTASLEEVRETALEGLALGAIWAVPPLAFGRAADAPTYAALLLVLSILMTAAAVTAAALPLSTLLFVTVAGGALAVQLALQGFSVLAAAAGLFMLLLIVATIERGRALVVIRAAEIAIAERDETVSLLLREFEDAGSDWLWEIDAQRRVVRANPRFALSIGADPATINGTPFLQLLAGPSWDTGDFAPELRQLADKLKQREAFRDLLLPVLVDGQQRWWEMSASPRFDDRGAFVGFRGVGSDVTEQRRSADKINRMARFDTLTGLPNRRHVNEALVRAVADAERWGARCAFMMIDLDRFKAVNDTLGHPVGDRLLGRVSERLQQMMTDNEIIGRLGGDEFAVVVRDANDSARVERLARTIIEVLSRPYEVDNHTLYIGASVGLAIGPRDGRTAEMLIRSADLALYRSKDQGGGVFHAYEPQLHVAAEERRVLEIALRSAVENGQLHLAYQPVVSAATGQLNGFEALVRWTHPEHGAIPPSKFIPLAEDARLIVPIGEWVLRTACQEAARWHVPARIAVNVSPEQLHNPAFASVVAQALAQSGLPAERLELEVTESVFMREGTAATQVLEKVLDLGVRLSLDDFGTGYSSLGYLAHTRFSSIKIDRSFIQAAARGGKEAVAIIRAVVALAESLGMATTAEGVETEEEHLMVQRFGCTKVQGYYFGRPLPVEEARQLTMHDPDSIAAA